MLYIYIFFFCRDIEVSKLYIHRDEKCPGVFEGVSELLISETINEI